MSRSGAPIAVSSRYLPALEPQDAIVDMPDEWREIRTARGNDGTVLAYEVPITPTSRHAFFPTSQRVGENVFFHSMQAYPGPTKHERMTRNQVIERIMFMGDPPSIPPGEFFRIIKTDHGLVVEAVP